MTSLARPRTRHPRCRRYLRQKRQFDVTLTDPRGNTTSIQYDLQGNQLARKSSKIEYQNYQWMVPTRIQTPGATKTLTLDALQRPVSIAVKNSATNAILASRNYQYDKAGNITQINSDLGETTYGYDGLDRLTQATPNQSLQTLGLPVEQYSYDAVHNRTSSAHQPGAWSYNKDNQLTQYPSVKAFEVGAPAIETQVTYTAQGHTKTETNSQGEKSYGYNAAERLTSFSDTLAGQASAQIEASYRYDPFGRRISKSVKEGATSKATYFLYNDTGLIGEANEQGQLIKAYGFNPVKAQEGVVEYGSGLAGRCGGWKLDGSYKQFPLFAYGSPWHADSGYGQSWGD